MANDVRLVHLRRLAYWLDDGIPIPGTTFRIGLDPIIGLVPGVGDVVGAMLAAGILMEAASRGVSRFTLVRMAYNVAIDALVGAVPVAGDAFDVAWKANRRNITLLDRHISQGAASRRGDRLFAVLLTGGLLLLCAALFAGGMYLSVRLLRALTG